MKPTFINNTVSEVNSRMRSVYVVAMLMLVYLSCESGSDSREPFVYPDIVVVLNDTSVCGNSAAYNYSNEKGCDGKVYPDPKNSPYVIPFPPETSFNTGLTNCSSSYHAQQFPDRYAFDFDVEEGTNFYAAREGTVVYVRENQSSLGGGSGNWVVVDHKDDTFGVYLHSPKNGISVEEGDTVTKGQLLGITGRSGLAGYPHLHFIVVQNDYQWPYDPIPITFSNILPADVIVKSYATYKACTY